MIKLGRTLSGSILDVGGGGEGIIGRIYQEQVVAIDNSQEELDEAPGGFQKLLMDATDLQFEDKTFDHVTFFFSLMYMRTAEQKRAIREAARVLKAGGMLHIWDCEIPSAYPEPFCIDVDVLLPEEKIHTTYGVGKLDSQTLGSISFLCLDAAFTAIHKDSESGHFHLVFRK